MGDRDSEVNGGGGQSGGFITVSGWVKLGSKPPVNVKLDASEVGCFWCSVFSEVCAFFGEEVGAFLAGSFPAFTEPGVTAAPVIEGVIRWLFRVLAEQLQK